MNRLLQSLALALAAFAGSLFAAPTVAANPNDIAGLGLWLRADAGVFSDNAGTTLATMGQNAERWNDQSGFNRTADGLGSGTNLPTFQTNVVNGLPVVRFDGDASTDRMALRNPVTTTANPIALNPSQLTIFAVVRQAAGDLSQDMVFTHRSSGTELIQAELQGTSARMQMRGSGNSLVSFTAPGLVNGQFNIVMYQFDRVNDLHAIAVNGAAEVINTTDFGVQTFNADTQRIGYVFNGGSNTNFLNGDLAELIVYSDVLLSAGQKNDVGFYLQDKYGINAAYVAPPAAVIPEPATWLTWLVLGMTATCCWQWRRCASLRRG